MKSRKYVELLWDCLYVYWDIINSNSVAYTCISIIVCVLNILRQKKNVVSDRCRSKYCDVSGTEHALYVPAAQRALIRAHATEQRQFSYR